MCVAGCVGGRGWGVVSGMGGRGGEGEGGGREMYGY